MRSRFLLRRGVRHAPLPGRLAMLVGAMLATSSVFVAPFAPAAHAAPGAVSGYFVDAWPGVNTGAPPFNVVASSAIDVRFRSSADASEISASAYEPGWPAKGARDMDVDLSTTGSDVPLTQGYDSSVSGGSVTGFDSECDGRPSSFKILQLETSGTTITAFAASFRIDCPTYGVAHADVTGEIRLNSSVDYYAFSVSPLGTYPGTSDLIFPATAPGASSTQDEVITNTGTLPLRVSAGVPSTAFSVAACPTPVPVAGQCRLTVRFQPPTAGTITGTLPLLTPDLPRTTRTVRLSGTGACPTAPTHPSSTLASDGFPRSINGGWGCADIGGTYSLQGTASDFNTTGSTGTLRMAAGANRAAMLGDVTTLNADIRFRVALNKLPVGGQAFVYGIARHLATNTGEFRAKIRIAPNGAVYMQATSVNGSETDIGAEVRAPALTAAAGSFIWVHAQILGSSPTSIRMRAWASGASEPSAWAYAATSAVTTLQGTGTVGLRAYMGSGVTNGPITLTFDDFSVGTGGGSNTPPVVDSVSVTPTEPTTNQTVSATYTAHDADGNALTPVYQWVRNGVDIAGATRSSLDLSTPGNGDHGDVISLRMWVNDGTTNSAAVTSSFVNVINSRPTASVAISPRNPGLSTTLRATATTGDIDADPVTVTWKWTLNGTTVRSVASSTLLTDSLDLSTLTVRSGDTVSVQVTPKDGTAAGDPGTDVVTLASSTPTVIASDGFGRTVANGWGVADMGGTYTILGTASDYAVDGSSGTMKVAAVTNRSALLGTSALNTEISFRFALSALPVGGQEYVYGVLRHVSSTTEYRAKVRVAPNGNVFVEGTVVVNGVETDIAPEVRVTGVTATAGTYLWLRAQTTGTSPTTVRMRAWLDGAAEPQVWQFSATNGAATLQVAGTPGVRVYTGSGTTNGPVTVRFDELLVVNLP